MCVLKAKSSFKNADVTKNGIPLNTPIFVNQSLYSYYKFLWWKCKKLWLNKVIIILGIKRVMAIFYISIYLIITVLLNDANRFCLRMPFSDDSCRTEICRARRSPGVCAMGVFTACDYRTDNRCKFCYC